MWKIFSLLQLEWTWLAQSVFVLYIPHKRDIAAFCEESTKKNNGPCLLFIDFQVGCFDPYSDDPRLGIQKISLCKYSGKLVAAGTAGQVRSLVFKD